MNPLAATIRVVNELREKLKTEYGLEDDDEALVGTIEGETDLGEQLARIARDAIRTEAMAKGLTELIKENQSRKTRLELRAEKLRAIVSWSMQEAGLKKIPAPDMTISLSMGKPPILLDEDIQVPEQFCRVEYEPDKRVIRDAIERGEHLPFARLGNPSPVLTIKRT